MNTNIDVQPFGHAAEQDQLSFAIDTARSLEQEYADECLQYAQRLQTVIDREKEELGAITSESLDAVSPAERINTLRADVPSKLPSVFFTDYKKNEIQDLYNRSTRVLNEKPVDALLNPPPVKERNEAMSELDFTDHMNEIASVQNPVVQQEMIITYLEDIQSRYTNAAHIAVERLNERLQVAQTQSKRLDALREDIEQTV